MFYEKNKKIMKYYTLKIIENTIICPSAQKKQLLKVAFLLFLELIF